MKDRPFYYVNRDVTLASTAESILEDAPSDGLVIRKDEKINILDRKELEDGLVARKVRAENPPRLGWMTADHIDIGDQWRDSRYDGRYNSAL